MRVLLVATAVRVGREETGERRGIHLVVSMVWMGMALLYTITKIEIHECILRDKDLCPGYLPELISRTVQREKDK